MTKSKARERAKARAAGKGKQHDAGAAKPAPVNKPESFASDSLSIKGPSAKAGGPNFAAVRRGSARSK